MDVIDVGQVATPMLYFAAHHFDTLSGVMVTGSHNPPEYNGLKMMLAGETLAGEAIQQLKARIEHGKLARGAGGYRTDDVREDYLQRITGDVRLARPMRLVVDCGNGVAGATAPELYRRLGCEVAELFCEVDGNFPNHHPDPSQPGKPRRRAAGARRRQRRARPRLRRRRRPPRRGHEERQDHLPRPPADAVRRRRTEAQPRRRGDLRRQVHAQPVRVDPAVTAAGR